MQEDLGGVHLCFTTKQARLRPQVRVLFGTQPLCPLGGAGRPLTYLASDNHPPWPRSRPSLCQVTGS